METVQSSKSPESAPAEHPLLRPKDPDWDDYWAHKIADKARLRVLAYFGGATVLLALIGLKSIDEVKKSAMEEARKYIQETIQKDIRAAAEAEKDRLMKDFAQQLQSAALTAARDVENAKRATGTITVSNTSGTDIDLSQEIGTIGETGPEGTAVGFSIAYAVQAEIKRSLGKAFQASPRGIYVLAKKYDEWPDEDYEGTSVAGGMTAVKNVGVFSETKWPYAQKQMPAGVKPDYKITSARRIPMTREAILAALRNGKVVVASIMSTEDFLNAGKDGRVTLKKPARTIGGTSVALVGYNAARAEFRFANMWGTSWGDKGFGYISDQSLVSILVDAFVINDVKPVENA